MSFSYRGQYFITEFVSIVVGEGSVQGLKDQVQRDALFPFGDLGACVDVEDVNARKELAARRPGDPGYPQNRTEERQ